MKQRVFWGALVAGFWGGVVLQACTQTPEPLTPDQAFQAVCTAAVVLETSQRGVEVPLGIQRLCADPELPGRILALLGAVEPLVRSDGPPDAGR